jgi:outer membrane beta-barrel protein
MNVRRCHRLLWVTALTVSSLAFAGEEEPVDLPAARSTKQKVQDTDQANGNDPEVLGDRVRSFQPKQTIKRGRVAINASGLVSINDAFQNKVGGSAGVSYYLKDTFSFGVRGAIIRTLPDLDLAVARQNFQLAVVVSQPNWLVMGDLEFSPIYGKFRVDRSIVSVDGFVVAGAGTVIHRSAQFGFEAGAGLRFVAADFLAFTLSWLNSFYVDQPVGATTAFLQNLMTLNLGFSVYLPFSSPERSKQ